jgi:photosystem II P680 reaction center D1 protein
VFGFWFTSMGGEHDGLQPERLQLQPVDPGFPGSRAEHLADVLNCANLGMEGMHKHNAHDFPLDLATIESIHVALTAPLIG